MPERQPLKRLACLGEAMIELATVDDATAQIGVAGDTYNTAVYLRRLLSSQDATVSYVTALGDDSMSERIVQHMAQHNVGAELVEIRKGMSPGLYAINTDQNGERSFSYWRDSAAARTLFQSPADVTFERLLDLDLLYVSGISLAILPVETRAAVFEFVRRFREQGGLFAFDSNYRPRLWENESIARDVVSTAWSLADIALPSVDDEMALFGDASEAGVVERLKGLGVSDGALKRGEAGPLSLSAVSPDPETLVFESASSVLDTTAAGDSFNAGWLAARARELSAADCLRAGHALARQVVQARGGIVETVPVF